MNLPYHCILADQYRAFPERADKWRRVKVSEPSRKRLAGNIVLRRFALPSPCIEGRGRRLAFISDLHFHGTAVEEQRVASLVGALTEAAPDVIFTGGDVIGDASDLRAIPGVLRRLASCARVAVAAPGNWERGKRWLSLDFWRELYTDGGFVFLCNEYRDLGVCGVYGGDDLVHGDPNEGRDVLRRILRLAGDLTPEGDVVVLDHDLQRVPRHRVFFKEAVEQETCDVITSFVAVSKGHPFRSFVHFLPHSCSVVSG